MTRKKEEGCCSHYGSDVRLSNCVHSKPHRSDMSYFNFTCVCKMLRCIHILSKRVRALVAKHTDLSMKWILEFWQNMLDSIIDDLNL